MIVRIHEYTFKEIQLRMEIYVDETAWNTMAAWKSTVTNQPLFDIWYWYGSGSYGVWTVVVFSIV